LTEIILTTANYANKLKSQGRKLFLQRFDFEIVSLTEGCGTGSHLEQHHVDVDNNKLAVIKIAFFKIIYTGFDV